MSELKFEAENLTYKPNLLLLRYSDQALISLSMFYNLMHPIVISGNT